MKIETRHMHGTVRLDLTGENAEEWRQIRAFVEALNGGPLSKDLDAKDPVFDLPVRVESVGFDDDGSIESIAIEGPLRC